MRLNAWVWGGADEPSVELTELAPQHLRFEVRGVASGRATRGLERFAEVTQQAFDVVSFDDAEEWLKNHNQRP